MKGIKIIVEKYNKTWRFSTKKYCGYIECDRIRKVMPISIIANPLMVNDIVSFQCDCGRYTHDDKYYHKLFYKGEEIKYE